MFRKRHLLIFFHEITGVLNGVFIFYSSFPSVQTKQFLFGHLEMFFFSQYFFSILIISSLVYFAKHIFQLFFLF